MLPILPVLFFLFEVLVTVICGKLVFGDQMMHRVGELSICLIAWLILVRAFALLFSFLYAFARPALEQRQSWFAWSRTFVNELWAVLFAFSVLIPFRRFFAPKASGLTKAGETTVVFVHGLLSNSGVWWLFAKRLKHLKSDSTHPIQTDSLDLGAPFLPLEHYVRRLDQHLEWVIEHSHGPIVLVGHSMGGLVCRQWLNEYQQNRSIQLITLGTPHEGSKTARLIGFPNLRQMRPASDWLRTYSLLDKGHGDAFYDPAPLI